MRNDHAPPSPKVTVGIPLYQSAAFVEETVHSVLGQTFRDFEIVVINDGSTDDGPDRVRRIADPRVRVVTQENRGLAGARNSAIRHARGEYVALLDADDCWLPEKLERHVAHLDANPHIGVSMSASILVDTAGKDLGLVQWPAPGPYTHRYQFCRNPVGNPSATVLRRSVIDRIAFYDGKRGRECWFDEDFRRSEDVEFFLRLMVVGGCQFEAVNEPLTKYRIHPFGLSANIEMQLASFLQFREKVKTFAPGLEAVVGDEAEAYHRRYLARRAVRSRDARAARAQIATALRLSPSILFDEPAKTLTTLAAVAALHVLPTSAAARLETIALAWMGAMRRRAVPRTR